MVALVIAPRVKVSRPKLTACERVSSVRTLPPSAISAIAMRMLDVPMSMTAAGRTLRGTGVGTSSADISITDCGLRITDYGLATKDLRPRIRNLRSPIEQLWMLDPLSFLPQGSGGLLRPGGGAANDGVVPELAGDDL